MTNATFENLYDFYSPMVYSIALQLCPTEAQAEEVLLLTFQKLHQQNSGSLAAGISCCMLIVKLVIQTAQEEFFPEKTYCNFKIRQFQHTPLLHHLIVNQLSIDNYCIENNIDQRQVTLAISQEIKLIRKSQQQILQKCTAVN